MTRPTPIHGRRIPAPRLTPAAPALAALWLGAPIWAVLTLAEAIWRLI